MADEVHTHQKALSLNLDRSIYGTFAEIGAGQEVARWFYQVGGAAGTVAKTISAYDMTVSDAVYGKSGRYVSRERLLAMLDREYGLLVERLDAARGADTTFFAFADTVAARNYAGTNECHGWLGLRFQARPREAPSQVLLHVNLRDPANLLQQEALGILGVNLVYAAFNEREAPGTLLAGLFSGLSLERIELDAVELSGPAFPDVDPLRIALRVVRDGYANAIVLPAEGPLVPPTEVLRKRPILLERGLFQVVQPVHGAMLAAARARFREEFPGAEREPLSLFEISLLPAGPDEAPGDEEVLRRAGELRTLGAPVAITRLRESYRLTEFLRRYTGEPLRFVLGLPAVLELLEGSYYSDMIGGALEAMGKLLAENVRLYVFPVEASQLPGLLSRSRLDPALLSYPERGSVTADNLRIAPPIGHLYAYLLGSGWLIPLAGPAG
jgi:hypothetical protein